MNNSQSPVPNPQPPLVVITGPTASGKSDLALRLAECYGGEIICADSRTVYRGMDIGTAKPTADDQARVRHHLLDVAEPDQVFTASDFKQLAAQAVEDISRRGKLPFLVGGSGLYIDGLILDYQFGPVADLSYRNELDRLSVDQLQARLDKEGINRPENSLNKRQLMRALEKNGKQVKKLDRPSENVYVVAISTDKSVLKQRIAKRAEQMFASGVVDEAQKLAKQYGWDNPSMSGNIYPICRQVLDAEIDLDTAKSQFIARDWQLARRQLTWLRRHDFVNWFDLAQAEANLADIIEHRFNRNSVLG